MSKAGLFVLLALVSAIAAAWFVPPPDPQGVAGRLSYAPFLAVSILAALLISAVIVGLAAAGKRRRWGFRVSAVWLGVGLVWVPWELFAWFAPDHQPRNPWYLSTREGFQGSRDLPYERPPHLNWEGRAVGDLVYGRGESDPYAETVVFRTDREGFRNSQEIRRAEILFLGDSFTEAGNVPEEQTFARRVSRKLHLVGRNLGRAGYAPGAELVVFRKYGLKCRPRYVVWQISEGNDLSDSVSFSQWVSVGRPYWEYPDRPSEVESWQRRSPSFQLFTMLCRGEPTLDGVFRCPDGTEHPMRFGGLYGSANRPAGNARGWRLLAQTIQEGSELLKEQNVRLFVLLIPMKHHVFADCVELGEHARNQAPQWRDPQSEVTLGDALARLCRIDQIGFIDATMRLQKKAKSGELVYPPFDVHLSISGHAVVSDSIIKAIQQHDNQQRE